MHIKETCFVKDRDIAPVEQKVSVPLSSLIECGVVPEMPFNDEYVELDHNKVYGRPADVFEALSMQRSLISAGQAAAMSNPTTEE